MEMKLCLHFQSVTGNRTEIKGLENLFSSDYESVALPLSYAGVARRDTLMLNALILTMFQSQPSILRVLTFCKDHPEIFTSKRFKRGIQYKLDLSMKMRASLTLALIDHFSLLLKEGAYV